MKPRYRLKRMEHNPVTGRDEPIYVHVYGDDWRAEETEQRRRPMVGSRPVDTRKAPNG